MTFIDYIETQPGLTRWAINQYECIDKKAVDMGRRLAVNRDCGVLRALAANPSLSPDCRARNQIMADALERDPTGRLAAVPSLRAWAARPDGIGQTWISWYVVYVNAWIDAQKAPTLVPMQATGHPMEVVS
jgi:hypothetical protein